MKLMVVEVLSDDDDDDDGDALEGATEEHTHKSVQERDENPPVRDFECDREIQKCGNCIHTIINS